MSFRLFIYYCALLGGAAAFVGWAIGRGVSAPASKVLETGMKALFLGLLVAFALALDDALGGWSLRRLFAVQLRVLTAALGGAAGGLLGGLVGQGLFHLIPREAFRVPGWALTGLLIGASLGLFELLVSIVRGQDTSGAMRKVRNGVLGGAVGGLLGGALSLFLRSFFTDYFHSRGDDLLWSPSAWGFVALGLCIGLFIGLAQVLFKEAWLRVEDGVRPGRQLILSRPETTLGRAEACDLGLFGDPNVARLHARIVREGGRHILEDMGSPAGTFLNGERIQGRRVLQSGDFIGLGRNILRYDEREKSKDRTD
jgi:hypothetical protein